MTSSILDREMYSEAEAARLLRVAQSTLNYWLEGGERRGRDYQPIIRVERKGRAPVTWAEFVEAGLIRMYRRLHHVPMAELRDFMKILRREYGVPYPLAHLRPFVAERQLLVEAQDRAGLDPEFCLVALVRNQPVLTPASQLFLDRVTWDEDLAAAWRPHDDPDSPVRMRPDQRFGKPAVAGISTEVLWEHWDEGEDIGEIATTFDLDIDQVRWAVAYETAPRAEAS